MPRWVHPAWKTLGIAPTSDTRAIRTAYSAKLKAIDPEIDPQAFIALREAFEAAKIQAQWVDQADEDAYDDDELWDEEADGERWTPGGDLYQIRPSGHVPDRDGGPEDPAWETPAPPEPAASAEPGDPYWESFARPDQPERRSPWAAITPEDADAHARSLATLLYSQDREADPWPTEAQEEEMLAHWRAIVADPRMQEISYFGDAERWFSELVARTAAFSDPLVIPVTEYFGWLKSDGAIAQSPAVAYVTRRYRMLEFQRDVKQPKHSLNAAWRELVTPVGKRGRRGRVNINKVRQLLKIVRTRYPDLEGCFDAERVALWDGSHIGTGTGSGGDWGTYSWAVGLLLFIGLRIFASFASSSGSYEPPPIQTAPPPPIVYQQGDGQMPPVEITPAPTIQLKPVTPSGFPTIVDSELGASDADIDQALEQLYGDQLDIATIANRDPGLYVALRRFWEREKAAGIRKHRFAGDLADFLNRRFPKGVRLGAPVLYPN